MSLQERRACPSHCCPKHGCKYGYDDCPVFAGKARPTYPKNNGCEMCEREGDEQSELDRLQARVAELEPDARRWQMHMRMLHKNHGARQVRELFDAVERAIAEENT